MSRPLFLRLLIAISLASIVGFVLLNRIWHASAQFEEILSSLRSRSDVTELLGTPDYTFNSNTEMIDEMEGGGFVFERLPTRPEAIDIRELPEINGTACFYINALGACYLVYFDGDEIVAVYWAAT